MADVLADPHMGLLRLIEPGEVLPVLQRLGTGNAVGVAPMRDGRGCASDAYLWDLLPLQDRAVAPIVPMAQSATRTAKPVLHVRTVDLPLRSFRSRVSQRRLPPLERGLTPLGLRRNPADPEHYSRPVLSSWMRHTGGYPPPPPFRKRSGVRGLSFAEPSSGFRLAAERRRPGRAFVSQAHEQGTDAHTY